MTLGNDNGTDGQTDRQTDGQTECDAICGREEGRIKSRVKLIKLTYLNTFMMTSTQIHIYARKSTKNIA